MQDSSAKKPLYTEEEMERMLLDSILGKKSNASAQSTVVPSEQAGFKRRKTRIK